MFLVGLAFTFFLYLLTTFISQIITPVDIENLTNHFLTLITISKDEIKVDGMFCESGTLIGPESQIRRQGSDIQTYFANFCQLPNVRVLQKKYNTTHIQGDVYLNTAFVLWMWDGLQKPVMARMSFVFQGKKIFHLYSSVLPEFTKNFEEDDD